MNSLPLRKLLAVLLGALFLVGLSLSVVQSADMTVKMASAAQAEGLGYLGCGGCPDGDYDSAASGACAVMCGGAAFAVMPPVANMAPVRASEPPELRSKAHHASALSPDPGPPRSISHI